MREATAKAIVSRTAAGTDTARPVGAPSATAAATASMLPPKIASAAHSRRVRRWATRIFDTSSCSCASGDSSRFRAAAILLMARRCTPSRLDGYSLNSAITVIDARSLRFGNREREATNGFVRGEGGGLAQGETVRREARTLS